MPRSPPKPSPYEEHTDEYGSGERYESCYCGDAKQRPRSERAAKDEQCHEDADRHVEPDCVDGRTGTGVDALYPGGKGEAIVPRISVGYA